MSTWTSCRFLRRPGWVEVSGKMGKERTSFCSNKCPFAHGIHPSITSIHPSTHLFTFHAVEQRRALGAILGGVVADAAAMGVHWVYDPKELDRLFALREGNDMGLAFYEPTQSPFFSYESGRASPYGEQVRVSAACLIGTVSQQ